MPANTLVRSIYQNQKKPIEAVVKGEIPKWVNGTLFRNGPGRFRFDDKVLNHLFDGMACINKFQISKGRVFYTNQLLETEIYKKTLKSKKLFPLFGNKDPSSTIFSRFQIIFQDMYRNKNDNANINVVPFSTNQLYALTESSIAVRIDPKTLNIINRVSLMDHIKPTLTILAHPHIEDDGSWLSMGLSPKGFKISYDLMRFSVNKKVENACESAEIIAQIPSSHRFGLSYFHSFGLSKNFIIFLEQSLLIDMKSAIFGVLTGKPIGNSLKINPKFPTKIYLVNRKTGELISQKFYTDPQFTFHHINAFETNDSDPSQNELFIDVCSYKPEGFSLDIFTYDENDDNKMRKFVDNSKAYARRIHVPLYKQNEHNTNIYCKITDINSNVAVELPAINYFKYNAKPYNYAYCMSIDNQESSIVKLNVNNYNDYKLYSFKTNNQVFALSEPVFVEHPEAKTEDDGVLLTIALGDKYDSLIVLDAKTLEEIACAQLPEDVKATFTFHGFFADTAKFSQLN